MCKILLIVRKKAFINNCLCFACDRDYKLRLSFFVYWCSYQLFSHQICVLVMSVCSQVLYICLFYSLNSYTCILRQCCFFIHFLRLVQGDTWPSNAGHSLSPKFTPNYYHLRPPNHWAWGHWRFHPPDICLTQGQAPGHFVQCCRKWERSCECANDATCYHGLYAGHRWAANAVHLL